MTYQFAAETEVPPERSRAEIERLLRTAGCEKFALVSTPTRVTMAIEFGQRRFRFVVAVPHLDDAEIARLPGGRDRTPHARRAARDQLERSRWRALLIAIKAQLAMVEVGMIDFGQAFLANLILPSGRTVAEDTAEPIRLAYQGADVPMLQGFQ